MKIPEWIKKGRPDEASLSAMKSLLRSHGLHTVCEEAYCPNIGECFGAGTATFLIMGDICTRNCAFCGVKSGPPAALDKTEPERIAAAAKRLGLKHVVITSVTRDDLEDGGASHFVEVIKSIRSALPESAVEVLVPDFKGETNPMASVVSAKPNVVNHNVETVPQLYPMVRSKASYFRSLELLSNVRQLDPSALTKSGLMVGLGETLRQIKDVMIDLRTCGVSMLTVGQYLRPPGKGLGVRKYYTPEEFKEIEDFGYRLGFEHVASGAFVRSSFHAALPRGGSEKTPDDRTQEQRRG
jgi:lipoic acid synthetase